eukprot:g3085.t1
MAEVKKGVRQAMHKKTAPNGGVFEIVAEEGVITFPGLHEEKTVVRFLRANPTIALQDTALQSNRDWKQLYDLAEGDLICIFENRNKWKAMIARVTSNAPTTKIMTQTIIFRREGYRNQYNSDIVRIQSVNRPIEGFTYTSHEVMVAVVRNVEVVGYIDSNHPLFQKYWKFQGHILRLRQPCRFINLDGLNLF